MYTFDQKRTECPVSLEAYVFWTIMDIEKTKSLNEG
jgi:hypothetical protein